MEQLANQLVDFVENAFNMEYVEFKQDKRVFCEQLKSIADNSGRIFVSNAYGVDDQFSEVFLDTFKGGLFKPCDSKNFTCQDNSLISFNNDIYSIGGRVIQKGCDFRGKIKEKVLKCCERYDINAD